MNITFADAAAADDLAALAPERVGTRTPTRRANLLRSDTPDERAGKIGVGRIAIASRIDGRYWFLWLCMYVLYWKL